MDQRERMNDPHEAWKLILDGRQLRIWTALPGIIQKYYPNTQTVDVQPTIQGVNTFVDGTGKETTQYVNLPKLLDCPIQFPSGGAGGTTGQQATGGSSGINNTFTPGTASASNLGTSTLGNQPYGCTLTFPVQAGDECLVIFTSRGFDNWWQSGGIQPPAEARMHDLSDGFVLLGFRSQPRKLSNLSQTTCQLRSDDGITLIELDPKNQAINLRDNVNHTHVVVDLKNGDVNLTATNNVTMQDDNAKNYVILDVKNGNLVINVTNQVQITASKIVISGDIAQTKGGITGPTDVTTSSGVSINTHTHSDPQGGTTGPGQG